MSDKAVVTCGMCGAEAYAIGSCIAAHRLMFEHAKQAVHHPASKVRSWEEYLSAIRYLRRIQGQASLCPAREKEVRV